jgi:phenylacetate-CoA ligase
LVRAEPWLFLAEGAAGRSTVAFLTSGSTGTPIEIHHDWRSLLRNIPYGERERDPLISAFGSFRPKELYVGYETSTFKKVMAFYEENLLLPVRPRRRFVPLGEPVERVAEIANTERPDILVGYGGWLDLFFRTVDASGIDLHPPKMVLYMGEALPHGARELIEGKFGIPVMSRYNAVESFKIGFFCERRTGFHLHDDLCHVRIAGPGGSTLPAGEHGAVVISNLVNRATVLLNYPIGDIACLTGTPCPCGRTFRLLSELEGRLEDVLTVAGGRSVHPRAIWQVLKRDRRVLQYQLIQHSVTDYELRLAALDQPAFAAAVLEAEPELRRLLGAEARIRAVRIEGMERAGGGKFRAVVSARSVIPGA